MARRPNRKRTRWLVIAGTLAALAGGFTLVADLAVGGHAKSRLYGKITDVPARTAALVLGTAKYAAGGGPNLYYLHRIEAAAALYHAGKVRAIVVSGDNSSRRYNEPLRMKEDLMAQGVPAEHITCDFAGRRTLDSVVRIAEVFGIRDYVVVSQPFHVQRALFIADAHGHDAVGFGARDVPNGYGVRVRLREVLARAMAVLDVYLLHREPRFLGEPVEVPLR